MGILQGLESVLQPGVVQRLARGQADFGSPATPDSQGLHTMMSNASGDKTEQVFTQTAQQMDPQAYANHITPGLGGANPLGNLSSAWLGTIASLLVQHLTGAGGGMNNLLSLVPGLRTMQPSQMDATQVASLASYTQQNHPDIFGRVASQLGQQQPDLLHSFLGKAGLAMGAAMLARHFSHS